MIKLKEKETAQETFDFIVAKLREQGEPSVYELPQNTGDISCDYGVEGKKRCAVGHLMGACTFEGAVTIDKLVVYGLVENPKYINLLTRLQKDHDYPAFQGNRGLRWALECSSKMTQTAIAFEINPISSAEWYDYAKSKLNESNP